MQISLNNKGTEEKFTLISSWNDVTVENYARLVKYNDLSGAQKSLHTIGLFTDIPKYLIKQIDVVSLGQMLSTINQLQQEDTEVYTHTFTHEGVEYGMIPDLSAITLGEYADIETFINRDIIGNLCNIASVLFRPIKSKDKDSYTVEAYELTSAKERAKSFKTLSASQVQSALVFFWNLGSGLLATLGLFSDQIAQEMKKK
tara:strand:+ start:111 stop:713 length:603 start_codon:yes stop_codon:yes gene_type:complete